MDEAADALMTRLGFLLGDKIISGEPGSSYPAQDDGEVISSPQDVFSFKFQSLLCNRYQSFLKKLVLFRKMINLVVSSQFVLRLHFYTSMITLSMIK